LKSGRFPPKLWQGLKPVIAEEIPSTPQVQLPPGSDALTAKDLQQLISALHRQAKAGITNSTEKLDQIKLIMLACRY
jgi:hypothetical protein